MPTPLERAKLIEHRGSASAFKIADNSAQIRRGWVAKQKVDMVSLSTKLNHSTADAVSNPTKSLTKKSKVSKNLPTGLRAKHNVDGERI